ncbi:MAG: ABC transporter ATP-binding protein [Planctomycetota bacterium]|jgi:lipopolysaccharide transport system ATP-binding protein
MSSDSGDAPFILEVKDLGKCYHLYARPQDRLKQILSRGRSKYYKEFWALRNVGFDLKPGEALGIIGRNGSGKSTLLQMIAGTLEATEGQVRRAGRVGALLELGSGFNPEFTGRENVFMQGALLGFSQQEIEDRFLEITDFANIGEFIEQPVKTYSSGMYVRLAFSVQTLMEPDILVVDEALAVGDVAFQFKCMRHMKQLLEKGTAVLLVSHDIQAVRTFCRRTIWLHDGEARMQGDPGDVTSRYMQFLFTEQEYNGVTDEAKVMPAPAGGTAAKEEPAEACAGDSTASDDPGRRRLEGFDKRPDLVRWGSGEIVVEAAILDHGIPGEVPVFETGGRLHVELEVRAVKDVASKNIALAFAIKGAKGVDVIAASTYDAGERFPSLRKGEVIRAAFDLENVLTPGDYALILAVEEFQGGRRHYFDFVENAVLFKVVSQMETYSLVRPKISHTVLEKPSRDERNVDVC